MDAVNRDGAESPPSPFNPALASLRARQSVKWQSYDPDVIPLTVAETDFALAEPIVTALHEAVARSDTGYSMAVPALGEAVSVFAASRWDWEIAVSSVTPVADVGVGVVEVLRALTRPSDVVVICPPVYPPFFGWVGEAGARVLEVPLAHTDAGWRLDLEGLERAFASHPAVFVLCNPHNPVGRVHSRDELEAVVRLARLYHVTIVSDEIHGPLVLPGSVFTPLLSIAGAGEVAVSAVSASKAWNIPGLKCAAVVAASPTMQAVVDRLPPDTRWRVGHFGVMASVAAFRDGGEWLDRLIVALEQRRSLLADLLEDRLPSLGWEPPEATYLAWLDCSAIGPDNEGRDHFLSHGRVALEPGLRFGAAGAGFSRLNFGTSAEILDEATARMQRSLAAPAP